ncbi:tripartite motif-containing protein 43-like [Dipodomys spectabilis]|uniref:tripartite motif-containing protein 43-like n=1 Tax=Dipodomys spectabilis TaxID=105255 RepID=UPI001C540BA2|nr:tripartite motif-containing protein 43-like [Dipodomys spectabilis]
MKAPEFQDKILAAIQTSADEGPSDLSGFKKREVMKKQQDFEDLKLEDYVDPAQGEAGAFQKELRCAICINTFIEPVTLECGHSFCRPCLCLSWEETQIPTRCPVCRGPCQQRDLKTNMVLRSLVAIARRASLRHFLSSEEYMCGTHRETKQMFCEVDRALLCRSCSQSQEHRAHKHHPIDRAAEEQREMISKQMHAVWEKTQENQHNLQEKRRLINLWIWYVKLFRERLTQHRVEIAFNDTTRNQDLGSCVGHDNPYAVLNTEESFHFTSFGRQVFSSGKHYWEVSVDDSSTWALGVIRDSSIGSNLTESEDLFLLLFVKENTLSTIFTTSPLLPHYVEKPLGRVGVFLDLDDGSVSFWNVAKSSLIWRYPTGAVQFPVRPHFFSGSLAS